MTPDEFRDLLRIKSVDEIVESEIMSDDPGPITNRAALVLFENEARISFNLQSDHVLSTVVVGSAKLGFAILEKPPRNGMVGKPAYRLYDPGHSDVDVALVSPVLYTRIWHDLARYAARQASFPLRAELAPYMLNGWIRPDKFPPDAPQRCTDFKNLIQKVSRLEPFRFKRLRCGLYYSRYFLQIYQQRGVAAAKQTEMEQ